MTFFWQIIIIAKKRPSSWSDTSFWPVFLAENQQKGCQKVGKSTFTKSTFQTPG